jgi:hypothetical protein
MTDILDEVESDYRAEQLRAVAARYAGLAVAILVLALASVGGWQYWQARQARLADAAATSYIAAAKTADALVAGDTAGRIAAAAQLGTLAATMPPGYRTLTRLRQAALLADAGKLPQAQAVWDSISTDPDATPPLRQLASLLWVQRGLDTSDPAALRTRLVSLTTPDNPYHVLALESLALLDLRVGQNDAARLLLQRLTRDPSTPASVRGRDGALLSRLGS